MIVTIFVYVCFSDIDMHDFLLTTNFVLKQFNTHINSIYLLKL